MLIGTFMSPISIHHVHNFLWRLQQITPMASPPMTKGRGNSDSGATTTPFFFFYKHPNWQPKGILASPTKVKISVHPQTHDSSSRSTGSSSAKPHSFVWLLKRVPLLTATWTDDGLPSSVHCQDIRILGQTASPSFWEESASF
jgi:hypothetical protein